MSDDSNDSKAKRLEAARKKLREYQRRNMELAAGSSSVMSTSTTSIASSEKSDINTEMAINNDTPTKTSSDYFDGNAQETAFEQVLRDQEIEQSQLPVNSHLVNKNIPNDYSSNQSNAAMPAPVAAVAIDYQQQQQQQQQQHQQHLNAMQILINEKTQLTSELNKYRSTCHEQSSEIDELRSKIAALMEQVEMLQQKSKEYQKSQEQLSRHNAELMHKLSQASAQQEDQASHLTELQQQLKLMQNQTSQLTEKYTEKCKELELAQLRIQQISNEPNSLQDSRVEALTQKQFMYEQQIRDLQAMVQQFSQDKEQSSTQYQSYVQHLNAEVSSLNERNSELSDECAKLQERERQLVQHVSELEKELQKHLSQRHALNESPSSPKESDGDIDKNIESLNKQIKNLEERIRDFELERHEFQLKIKSQEDRLQDLQQNLDEKEEELEKIKAHLVDQPDQMKLLATMESDKIAASRALAQNIELKKQLDELELRFVQLTNDKAELMNKLDSEEFANREIRANFNSMEERVRNLDERFQFKDDEMIRLSHENMELAQKNSFLEKQLKALKEQTEKFKPLPNHDDTHSHNTHDTAECNGDHDHDHEDKHEHQQHHHHPTEDEKLIESQEIKHSESDSCEEAREVDLAGNSKNSKTPQIADAEAVEKLQTRFTYLMSQVADLTEEKQRLEHLVLQLQGETETIGEYIALYQTQRRILKQREYEKAEQSRLLQQEREILREKIGQLNQLVGRLGYLERSSSSSIDLSSKNKLNHEDIKSNLNAALAESMSIEPQNYDASENNERSDRTENNTEEEPQKVFDIPETNEILMKIQNIVTEIKENATKEMPLPVDHCHCCEGQLKVV